MHVQHAEQNFHFFFEIGGNQKKKKSFISRIWRYESSESAKENAHVQ